VVKARLPGLVVVLVLLACGRTAPVRIADGGVGAGGGLGGGAAGGGVGGANGGGPGGGAGVEPLLLDFTQGALTAHRLDASTAFTQRLTSTHQRTLGLSAGGGVVGWLYRDAAGTTVGTTRRDGTTAFRTDATWPLQLWANPHGVVVENVATSTLVLDTQSWEMPRLPVDGAMPGGFVPCRDEQQRLVWLAPQRAEERPAGDLVLSPDWVRRAGDRLYFGGATGVVEANPDGSTVISTPFTRPQVLAANARREALVSDPTTPRLLVVSFATAQSSAVRLDTAGLPAATPFSDTALQLDDDGRVYATFTAREDLRLMRTADLGEHWELVARVPYSTQATNLGLLRRADTLVVLGLASRGPAVDDARYAAAVDLATLRQQELPLGAAQTFIRPQWPLALTPDGAHVAFWTLSGRDLVLRRWEADTGAVVDVETIARPMNEPLGVLPALEWLSD
jgi:hypothetical protein